MSYSRLPLAMAQDGMLPRIFGKLNRRRAPWVAILALAIGWACCLGLGFERLVTIDILIYGASLTLEFLALIVLRVREPELKRPFRVPGGMFGAIAVGVAPVLLLGFDLVRSQTEQVWGMSSLALGAIVIAAGVLAYVLKQTLKPAGWAGTSVELCVLCGYALDSDCDQTPLQRRIHDLGRCRDVWNSSANPKTLRA